MKIIIDAFGGDNAPLEIIKGSLDAKKELGIDLIFVGDENKIKECAKENGLDIGGIEIIHTEEVFTMEDDPTTLLRAKKNTSMALGFKALKEGRGDAFASAGSSGGMVVGATLIAKRIKGIKRVAFAPVMPKAEGFFMLCDGGANNECRPEMIDEFALMGSVYMNKVMGIKNPRVGQANVGTEDTKGGQFQNDCFNLLKANENINFIGNIEARDIPFDAADVIVCDGFTGNVILKLYEGVAMALVNKIKGIFKKSLKNKLAAAMVLGDMKEFKKSMDYNEYGGAPILGASKPVFKIHGSAKANTVKNALKLTKAFVESDIIKDIEESVKNKETKEEN
ncbi:MAG: phosphate acyltransferase PlsX [Ruminococcaceae bacterium]|nr:phosphate acyltransferase PlsX [Oscillospiraceae bacterium]